MSLIGMVLYLRGLQVEDQETGGQDSWAVQAIVLGLVGIVGGRIPSYMAGMPLELRFDWDRLLISLLFGVSLLTAGLIDYLFKDERPKEVFIGLIVALAIGMQFQQSNTFRRDWENQKSFFWQLAWRAPSLKPGTALVTDELPLQYVADLQLSAPLWSTNRTPPSSLICFFTRKTAWAAPCFQGCLRICPWNTATGRSSLTATHPI